MIYFWLFGGLLVLLVATVVVSALQARETEPDEADEDPSTRLDAAVGALRETEFDYRTGKLSEEEYHALREVRGREALAARRELEAASRRRGPAGEPAATGEREGGEAPGSGAPRCATCGAAAEPGDRFCSECGAPLEGGAA